MTLTLAQFTLLVTFVTVLLNGPGSALRVEISPESFNENFDQEVNVTCIPYGPTSWAQYIQTMQVVKEDKPIAILRREGIIMGSGSQSNMQAVGHIDKDASRSFLTLTITNPDTDNVGVYTCLMYFEDESFQLREEKSSANLTIDNQDCSSMMTHLLDKFVRLEKTVQHQEKESKKQDQDMANMTNRLHKLESDNNKKDIRLQDLESDNNKKDIRLQDMESDNNKKDIRLQELESDNKEKDSRLDKLEALISSMNVTMTRFLPACPDGWTVDKGDNICVKFFGSKYGTKNLPWSEARKACGTFGGDLVKITNDEQNKFVFDLAVDRVYGHWIGVEDVDPGIGSYDFKYVDGSPLDTYHPWYPGHPTDLGDKEYKCVVMGTWTGYHGQWGVWGCSATRPYVCSIPSRTTGVF